MGIIGRLENVIKSYLNDSKEWDDSGGAFRRENRGAEDPDLRAAYAELDEFLTGRSRREGGAGGETAGSRAGGNRREGTGGEAGRKNAPWNIPPESLRPDFAELGLPFGAGEEECRAAYKRLLKLHHPDRHAGHQGDMEKATKKTARINAGYDRIRAWRESSR